jgi:acyl-CoA synthetase (AMP-forming)/AMP-acid ligase II
MVEFGFIPVMWVQNGQRMGLVYFKARLKRMIISSGYNVYPSYVENIINHAS